MWGIKHWACLVLSTWSAMFALRAFKEAKTLVSGLKKKDVEQINRIQRTGMFEIPQPDEEEGADDPWF